MNKRGQASIFTILFIVLIFIILLALALAPFITTTSAIAVQLGGLTGLEAFMIGNLLLWVIIIFIIWILWVTR
jgi:hypothetical protein